MAIYLSDADYARFIENLVNVEPSPMTGLVTETEIMWIVMQAGIFPARNEAATLAAIAADAALEPAAQLTRCDSGHKP